jgi:hypothetical protein
VLVAILAFALAAAPANAAPKWRPHVKQAAAYAAQRQGLVAFSVKTSQRTWGRRADRTFSSASVLKAMLLVSYLRQRDVRDRPLTDAERALLAPMIRRSDNAAASTILTRVGTSRLARFARKAGMRRFIPVTPIWGHSRITADDQSRFFFQIDRLVPTRHRAYAMRLLETITRSQRWGIALAQPPGWRLFFKGGWGSGTGLVDHQAALLTRGNERVSVAILTQANPDHAYGKETLRGVSKRLLRGIEAQAAAAR